MADMKRIRNGSPVDMVEAEKWTWMRYAIRALTRAETEGWASIARTDAALGIGKLAWRA